MGKLKGYISEYFSTTPINAKVTTLNLERVYMLTWLLLIVQIVNLFDKRVHEYRLLLVGGICMIVISIVYFCITTYLRRHNYENVSYSTQRKIYHSFWILFMAAMIPFYYVDDISLKEPLNALIFCCLIIAVPVMTKKELAVILSINFVLVSSVAVAANSGFLNILYGLLMNFAAYIISSNVHHSHIKLEIDAETDFLTKMPNRRLGQEQLKRLWKHCLQKHTYCCALIVDIDFFKDYNDTFGHFVGDVALIEVARCIRTEVKKTSDVVYRLGGEEFMLCMEAETPDEVKETAKRIREYVEAMHIESAKKDVSPYLTISIGLSAKVPEESETEHMLLYEADSNLYVAKAMGRNRISFEEKII